MTAEAGLNARHTGRTIAGFFAFFFGLCAVFVGVVTAVQGWEEHALAQWPVATAQVDRCRLDQSSTNGRNGYHIDCRFSYAVGVEQNTITVYSRNVPSRDVPQYPPNQIAPFEDWVANHPEGTPVLVHYDPSNHRKAVLATTSMPGAGPHTSSNLKLLAVVAAALLMMLTITQILR